MQHDSHGLPFLRRPAELVFTLVGLDFEQVMTDTVCSNFDHVVSGPYFIQNTTEAKSPRNGDGKA